MEACRGPIYIYGLGRFTGFGACRLEIEGSGGVAELLEEVGQGLLFGGAQAGDRAADHLGVAWEDAGDEFAAVVGELGVSGAAVGFAGAAADQAAFDELVDEEGDAAAADEDLLLDFAEEHRALVVEGFEDGEFGLSEAVGLDVGFGVGVQGFGRPGEDDVEFEGVGRLRLGHLSTKLILQRAHRSRCFGISSVLIRSVY